LRCVEAEVQDTWDYAAPNFEMRHFTGVIMIRLYRKETVLFVYRNNDLNNAAKLH